ncbi:TetR/AcrR family transcriptional regulator [Pacificimonas sp. ICDLI1SI03]
MAGRSRRHHRCPKPRVPNVGINPLEGACLSFCQAAWRSRARDNLKRETRNPDLASDRTKAPSPPATSIRQAHKDLTRARIADSARECFYAKGVEETSLEDIARGAGIRRPTVYLHFSNKNAILAELLSQNLAQVRSLYSQLGDPGLIDVAHVRRWLDSYVRILSRNREAMRLFQIAMSIDESSRALVEDYRNDVVAALGQRFPAFLNDNATCRAAAFMMIVKVDFVADAAAQQTGAFDYRAGLDLVAAEFVRMLEG